MSKAIYEQADDESLAFLDNTNNDDNEIEYIGADDESLAFLDSIEPEKEPSLLDKAKDLVGYEDTPDETVLDGQAPTVDNAIKAQDKQFQDIKNQQNLTQSEDTTTTRPFKDGQAYSMEGQVVNTALSPNEQDAQVQKNNKELLTGTGEEYENPTAPTGNNFAGAINRSNEVISNSLEAGQRIVDEFTDGDNTKSLKKLSDFVYKNNKLAYEETHSWNELKKAYKAGGLFDIDTWQELGNFSAETGAKSVADMAHMVVQLPHYIMSRSQEIAEERAKNNNSKEEPTGKDYAIAVPTAIGSVLLDRMGLKGMTSEVVENVGKTVTKFGLSDGIKVVAKNVKRGTIKEAGTEFAQEGIIEPTGERVFTQSDAPLIDIERGIAGLLAGGVMGGTMTLATSTGAYANNNPYKELNNYIDSMDFNGKAYGNANVASSYEGSKRNQANVTDISSRVLHPHLVREVKNNLPINTPDAEIEDIAIRVQEKLNEVDTQKPLEEVGQNEQTEKENDNTDIESEVLPSKVPENDKREEQVKEPQSFSKEDRAELETLKDKQHDEDFTEEEQSRMWELEDIKEAVDSEIAVKKDKIEALGTSDLKQEIELRKDIETLRGKPDPTKKEESPLNLHENDSADLQADNLHEHQAGKKAIYVDGAGVEREVTIGTGEGYSRGKVQITFPDGGSRGVSPTQLSYPEDSKTEITDTDKYDFLNTGKKTTVKAKINEVMKRDLDIRKMLVGTDEQNGLITLKDNFSDIANDLLANGYATPQEMNYINSRPETYLDNFLKRVRSEIILDEHTNKQKIGDNDETIGSKPSTTTDSGQAVGETEVRGTNETGETTTGETKGSETVEPEIKIINETRNEPEESISENVELISDYVNTKPYSSKDINHEVPIVEISKKIKKDLSKYAKKLAQLTGLDLDNKNGKPLTFGGVTTNIPQAGGEATFRLLSKDGNYEVVFTMEYNPDYTEELGYTDYQVTPMFWTSINTTDGKNKNITGNIISTASDPISRIVKEIKSEMETIEDSLAFRIKSDAKIAQAKQEQIDKKTPKHKPFGELELEQVTVAKLGEGKPEKVAEQIGEWIELPPFAGSEHGKYGRITGNYKADRHSIEVEVAKGTDNGTMEVVSLSYGTATTTSKADASKVKTWLKRFGYEEAITYPKIEKFVKDNAGKEFTYTNFGQESSYQQVIVAPREEQVHPDKVIIRRKDGKDKVTAYLGENDLKHLKPLAKETIKQDFKEFKKWFKGSKVVNSNGSPKVVFHGTLNTFSEFSNPQSGNSMYGRGIYFTSSSKDADIYSSNDPEVNYDLIAKAEWLAKDLGIPYKEARAEVIKGAGQIHPVYLSIKKPIVIGNGKAIQTTKRNFKDALRLSGVDENVIDYRGDILYNLMDLEGVTADEMSRTISELGTFKRPKYILEVMKRANNDVSLAQVEILETAGLRELATNMGADGMILHGVDKDFKWLKEPTDHYIVFNKNQIKSKFDDTHSVSTNYAQNTQQKSIIEEKEAENDINSDTGTGTKKLIQKNDTGSNAELQSGREESSIGNDDRGLQTNDTTDRADRPTINVGEERSDSEQLHNRGTKSKSVVKNQFTISQNDAITQGEVARFNDNFTAIKILKQNKPFHTKEDLQALSRYTGWGGVQKLFPDVNNGTFDNDLWRERNREFRDLVTPMEYETAIGSILDAFYTPPKVINTMWDISKRLGFDGGNVLEPSVGSGRFIGMTPNNIKNVSFDGIELDYTTSKIASILYPKSNIRNIGFEKTNHKDNFELVIGNPPYGSFSVYDSNHPKISKLNIHNYFVAKSIYALKDGGVANFVITSSFMENLNKTTAEAINKEAKLVGAIRLPNNVFKSAGTEVTTDIVIFQKLKDGEVGNIEEWFGKEKQENGININKYFHNNPTMLLGKWEKGFRGNKATATLGDFEGLLNNAIENLPENIMPSFQGALREEIESQADKSIPPSVIYEKDGKYYVNIKTNERIEATLIKGAVPKNYIKLRDSLKNIIELQNDPQTKEATLEKARKELNKFYDYFVAQHGELNKPTNRNVITNDNFGFTVLSLEKEGKKTDIFTKRTSNPERTVKTKNTKEALTIVLNTKGSVDIEALKEITGKSEEVVIKELTGEIFFDATLNKYVPKNVYLSGDVKTKLANTDDDLATKELLKVVPKDLEASDIPIQMGVSWVSPDIMEQFASEMMGFSQASISFNKELAKWGVRGHTRNNPFSIPRIGADAILEKALNQKKIVVKYKLRGATIIDDEATAYANQKLEDLKDTFNNWIFKDAKRADKLTSLYNELYNRNVGIDVDKNAESYNIPNLKPTIKDSTGKVTQKGFVPRKHQKEAVYRAVYGNSPLLLNHPVGSGKTLTSQMIVMEWKRLGIANKPVIATLKSVVPQFANEFKMAYPNANILVPNENDFKEANRKKLLSSIATGDYDAIIITHDNLKALQNPIETEREVLEERIAELEEAVLEAEGMSKSRLQDRIKKIKADYAKITDASKDTDVLSFEKLGIDGIVVDESHKFKKIGFSSTMDIKGIDTQESQMGVDLLIKTRHILKSSNNVVLMTGTPITNTLPELFSIQRMLQPELLKSQGIFQFDSWAKQYTVVDTDIEVTGVGKFKEVDRIKRYVNLETLYQSIEQVIDTVNNEEIKKNDSTFILPKLKGNKPTEIVLEPSDLQTQYTEELDERLETVNDKENDDNYLAIFGDAQKMSLDIRFVMPEAKDNPNSKASVSTDLAYQKYIEFNEHKGVQLIFSDLGVPNTKGRFDFYQDIKNKLIAKGVPENEIALIADFDTVVKKNKLTKDANSGKVRFIIGSTQKLGTGINMQERIVAIHHLDIPYTPAEVEQRDGRMLRQGNKLIKLIKGFEVEKFLYATEKTLDGSKWQILKNKAQFIQQFQDGVIDEEIEIDEGSLKEQAEKMIALSSGNPLLLERLNAEKDLKKLRALKVGYNQARNENLHSLSYYEKILETSEDKIDRLKEDKKQVENNPIKINGKELTKQSEIGQALLDEILLFKTANGRGAKKVGTIGDIDIQINYNHSSKKGQVIFLGESKKDIDFDFIGQAPTGLGVRVKNIADPERFDAEINGIENSVVLATDSIPTLKKSLDETFSKEQEFNDAQERIDAINQDMADEAKANETKVAPGAKVEEYKTNKNTSIDKKTVKATDKNTKDTEFMSTDIEESMPNNPPLLSEQESLDSSSILNGYEINRSDGTYLLDGKRIKYPLSSAPIGVKNIREQVAHILGYSPYRARIRGKDIQGLYKSDTGSLRIRNYSDTEFMAHEVGHHIYYELNMEELTKEFQEEVSEFSYTKDPDLLLTEGYAEFMRAYFTNSSWAKSKAPKFYKAFEAKLSKDKKLNKLVKQTQRYTHSYFAQGAVARTNSQMSIYPYDESLRERFVNGVDLGIQTAWDKFQLEAFDRTHGFYNIENMINGDNGLYINKASPTNLLRTALGGATSTYEQVVVSGVPQKTGDSFEFMNGAKGLQAVFKPLLKDNKKMEEWTKYALLRNAVQLEAQGKKHGFFDTKDNIDTQLEELESANREFADVFDDYQEFNDNMLEFYKDMSYITTKTMESFKAKNPIYLPTHRIMQNIQQGSQGNKSTGFRSKSKTGSDLLYNDIVDNITAQLHTHIQGAMIANAKSEFFSMVMNSKDGAKVADKISKQAYFNKIPIGEQAKNILAYLEDSGMTIEVTYPEETVTDESEDITTNEEMEQEVKPEITIVPIEEANEDITPEEKLAGIIIGLEENTDLLSYFTFGNPPKKIADSRVVQTIINDVDVYFELANGSEYANLLATTLDSFGSFQMTGLLAGAYNVGIKVKDLKTKIITTAPQFKAGNIKRDYAETIMWRDERKGAKSFKHPFMAGAKSFSTQDEFYKLYMLNGGGYGSFVEANTEHDYKDILLDSFGEKFFRAYSVDEYANRLAVAMEAKEAGLSWQQAVAYGRAISLDFSMRGSNQVAQVVTNLSPFLRASMNGTYKMVQEGRRKGRSGKAMRQASFEIIKKGGKYLTALSMVAFFLGYDDERYKKLTADEKARYLWFFYSDDAKPIQIEIPHAVGFLTQKIPEYLMDMVFGTDVPKGTHREAVIFALKNQIFPHPDAGIFTEVYELGLTNKNFKGDDIVPYYVQDRESPEQFNAYTREIYKDMGKTLDMSPVQIQHLIRSLMTYPERTLGDLSDIILWDRENKGEPLKTVGQVALEVFDKNLNKGGYATARSAYQNRYYEIKEKANKLLGSLNFLKRNAGSGELKRLEEFIKEKDIAFGIGGSKTARGLEKAVQKYREQQLYIRNSKKTTKEKQTELESINKKIVQRYKTALIELEKLEKQLTNLKKDN